MTATGFVIIALSWSLVLWSAAKLLVMAGPSPQLAQTIWRGAALLMALPFVAALVFTLIPSTRGLPLPNMPLIEVTVGDVVRSGIVIESTGPARPQPSIETFIGYLLVTGWALRLVVMMLGQYRLQRLKNQSVPSQMTANRWAHKLNLKTAPQVKTINSGSPFVAGILKREIHIPTALSQTTEIDQVIAHECVHLARGDLIAMPIERLVAEIFWISPFAWLMRSELDYWREVVVDDVAATLTGDRFAYARALTLAARVARPEPIMPVAAFILPKKGTLKMRLNTLLDTSPYKSSRVGLAAAALMIIAVPIALAQGAGVEPEAEPKFTHAILDKARLSSAFGLREHPTRGGISDHKGIDLAEAYGEPIYAPCDGVVAATDKTEGYGRLVTLYADGSLKLRFAQLSEITVHEGQKVKAGDIIGKVGKSGKNATGPHLHLEAWLKEQVNETGEMRMKPVDPMHLKGLVLADVLRMPDGTTVKSKRAS